MEKYKLLSKIAESPECTIFRAQYQVSMEEVAIKKLHGEYTWEQILASA